MRTRRGVRLSGAGRALLPHAERALGAIQEGARAVDQQRRGEVGHLAVGASPAVSTYLLPDALRRFQHAHPNVHLSVRTGHSEEILDLVLRHEVEVGLVREIRHPDVEATPLYEDELVLVVAPGHPFAERGRIRIAELAREHLVTFDRASSYNELTQALFREAGVAPRGVIELDNVEGASAASSRVLASPCSRGRPSARSWRRASCGRWPWRAPGRSAAALSPSAGATLGTRRPPCRHSSISCATPVRCRRERLSGAVP